MKALLAALVSCALAALLAVAAYASTAVLAAAAALAVVIVAVGWAVLLRLPDPRGTAIVIAALGWIGIGVALLARDRARPLAAFAAVVALAVLVAFVHEVVRGGRRERLVESVTGTLTGEVVAALAAGWVLMPGTVMAVRGVVVAVSAVAAARVVGSLSGLGRLAGWAAFLAGVVAAGAAAQVLGSGRLAALIIGAVVAAVVAGLDRLLIAQPTASTPIGLLAGAAVPVAATGTVAYAVALLVTG